MNLPRTSVNKLSEDAGVRQMASWRWERNIENGGTIRMHARRLIVALAVALIGALVLAGPALGADPGGRPLSATLTGSAEVPGPGDPDGIGEAGITINPGQGEVCWAITVEDIMLPARTADIHLGSTTDAGPVVVTLSPPDASGSSSGCRPVDRELAKAILKNPEGYYVDVHTLDFLAGAIRGQLSK
jgi:hypothetical protein